MTHFKKTLPFLLILAMATPSLAQSTDDSSTTTTTGDATAETIAEGEPVPDPMALSEGASEIGSVYSMETHGDWDVRCIRAGEGQKDPCQLYQLLDDGNGNPVAEINIFPLGGEGQPAAGATIITPLETLLTEQLALSVDGGSAKKYPFSWCSQIGCFSRLGLSPAEIASFKAGISAAVTIVPVAAPNQKINLKVSLKGFTAGFTAVQKIAAAE